MLGRPAGLAHVGEVPAVSLKRYHPDEVRVGWLVVAMQGYILYAYSDIDRTKMCVGVHRCGLVLCVTRARHSSVEMALVVDSASGCLGWVKVADIRFTCHVFDPPRQHEGASAPETVVT